MTWMYGPAPSWAPPAYDYYSPTPSYYTPPPYYYEPPPVYYSPPPTYYEPPPYYYSPPPTYYEPPPYYYSPPAYEPPPYVYTPPVYDYSTSTPSYSWEAPSYSWSAPTYSDPVASYTPDPYNWGPTKYDWEITPLDFSKPSYNEFLYTSDPMAYNTDQIKNYVEDTYNVDYNDYLQDYYGGAGSNLGAGAGAAQPDYYDYDYVAPEPTASSFNLPESAASSFDMPDFSRTDTAMPSAQFAALSPSMGGVSDVVSDSQVSPMGGLFSRSMNVEGGGAPVGSASGSGISLNPGDGSSITTGSGETIDLSDADTLKLLRGETTLAELAADKAESATQRLSPTTVATERGLSLSDEAPYGYGPTGRPLANDPAFAAAQREIADMNEARTVQGGTFQPVGRADTLEETQVNPFLGKMPEYDPAKMEGTRAQYATRQADEMARAEAGVPANQEGYARALADLDRYNVSNYVTPENQRSFDANLRDIMENRGGFTSQWQTVGSDRVMVNDDGTGIGINENGEPYTLTAREVDQMIRNKQLNTKESGYVAATGGTGNRPGGSPKDSGFKLPFKFDAKAESGKGGGGGGGGGGGDKKKKGGMNPALLLGLLAALAANKGKGGAAGPVIPGRELQRTQTGYGGAGRRAGSSAQQYFTGPGVVNKADGGMLEDGYAGGGIASLGGYSDGGRLLRGPGDGVSDSIPAVIGKKQPARLADGEFVVPARIVSELGNGSTEAGARKLYAMMERIQRDRKKSVGKNKVAVNSRADKHLPK